MSIRSIGSNDLKGLPAKDSNSKEHKADFHSTPIRYGRDSLCLLYIVIYNEKFRELLEYL